MRSTKSAGRNVTHSKARRISAAGDAADRRAGARLQPIQDGRIYIEKLNGPMLFDLKTTPAEYSAGLKRAIELGWLVLHESGTFVRFTQAGAEMFA